MALHFLTSTNQTKEVVVTCDPSVSGTEDQQREYINTGDLSKLDIKEDATRFILKPLGPTERERAEIRAGAFSRSELGRLLWIEAPNDSKDKARWHHKLDIDEREALGSYESYISRVYLEMISESLVSIDGKEAGIESIQKIRPDSFRLSTITELVLHIQRMSLIGDEGK